MGQNSSLSRSSILYYIVISTGKANNPNKHWIPAEVCPSLINSIPQTQIRDDAHNFKSARKMAVNIDVVDAAEVGRADVYVDDVCTIGVLKDKLSEAKLQAAALLAIETISRPLDPHTHGFVKHENIISMDKLHAEAGLSETKILLGWELDTRQLLVRLMRDKYESWTSQLQDIIANKGLTSKKALETVIGRLNHVASIIPLARHFMSCLNFTNSRASMFKPIFLNKNTIEDMTLWLDILHVSRQGISMNLLTFRHPDIVYWSDACNSGIGGYSSKGHAWRWQIPTELQNRAHINLLEFIAELICIWVDIMNHRL